MIGGMVTFTKGSGWTISDMDRANFFIITRFSTMDTGKMGKKWTKSQT